MQVVDKFTHHFGFHLALLNIYRIEMSWFTIDFSFYFLRVVRLESSSKQSIFSSSNNTPIFLTGWFLVDCPSM